MRYQSIAGLEHKGRRGPTETLAYTADDPGDAGGVFDAGPGGTMPCSVRAG